MGRVMCIIEQITSKTVKYECAVGDGLSLIFTVKLGIFNSLKRDRGHIGYSYDGKFTCYKANFEGNEY